MVKKLRFDTIIFGGNGQDGYLMSRFLLKQKKKLIIIVRKKNERLLDLKKKNQKLLKIIIFKNFNLKNYLKLIEKINFKNVYFFAGYSKIPKTKIQQNICIDSNYLIFKNFLYACLKKKIKPRILYTSSGEIYGSSQLKKKNEYSKFKPDNCYAECKIKTSQLINKFRKHNKFFIINAICYNHESIFTPKNHLLRKIIESFANKNLKKVKIFNPNEKRNISHVYDFLPLFQKSIKSNKSDNYIFANTKNISVKQISNLVNKKYQKKIYFVDKKNNSVSRMANNENIKNKFKYNPKFTNEKIISRMISYYTKNTFIK